MAAMCMLVNILYGPFSGAFESWQQIIILVSVASMGLGSFVAIRQTNIKRLLAYSSISHMGYMLISFSTGTLEGVQSLLAYMFIYMLASSCLWSIFLLLRVKSPETKKKHNKDLSDLSGILKTNRIIALIFSTVLFSIAGFPPLIGFLTKMNIFLSCMESSMYFVAVISILSSVISTFYYIRIIKILCFENKPVGRLYHAMPYHATFIVVLLFFSLVFLFINPNMLYLISYKISLLVFF